MNPPPALSLCPLCLCGFLFFATEAERTQRPVFEEVLPARSHIIWTHDNAMSPQRYMPETMGPGCAFLDYNNDGWMDIYLVNSGPSDFYKPAKILKNALYRNNRDGTFTDVTDQARVGGGTFGMGVAAADYDKDGYTDILVTSYGKCLLYHNNKDGTFSSVADAAGVSAPGWTTSAVWFDYDNDGFLDLFLCSFVEFGADKNIFCGQNKLGQPYYCIPRTFKPTHSFLFRNQGNGTFKETDEGTAIARALGKALGVVATDINNDGLSDLFVANDTVQNFLFVNRGGDRWDEIALAADVGFSAHGQPRSGMGVDAADIDGDGWQDLFVANVDQEIFSLYRNNRDQSFTDTAHLHDVAEATRLLSGWGLKFLDFDNDGATDLFLANGHPDDMIDRYSARVKYREPPLLFHNDAGKLVNISDTAGHVFERSFPARGLAAGDFNNDGKIDVLVASNGQAPTLLENCWGSDHHWVGVRLQGVKSNSEGIGARISWSAGGVQRSRLKTGGGSYLSSHDPREVLGIGQAEKVEWVEVKWPGPSGRLEKFVNPPIDQYIRIREGRAADFTAR
ncbi:MAG TPA: CRTAC1 family protein [Acidobacteriota bacterium]|jgi:hypothetical protein